MWSWEEIQAARQHIFSSQLEADVEDRHSRWGGIPRMVLQSLDVSQQALLTTALDSCSLSELTSSLTSLSYTTSKVSDMLLHQTVDAGYLKGPVAFASEWVQGELISRYSRSRHVAVREFVAESGGVPSVAAFRSALWEGHVWGALKHRGSFICRDLQDLEAGPFEIELEPCSRSEGMWDIGRGLSTGVYNWRRSKGLPAAHAFVQPHILIESTTSQDHRSNARGMADAVRAIKAEESEAQLFYVVPPAVYSSYTEQILEQLRDDVAAECMDWAVEQFVLRVDI